METIIITLDFVIIIAAVWAIFASRGLGGTVGKAFGFMMWGMIFLGVAHIFETVTLEVLKWNIDVVELVHRLIVLLGVIFLTFGFNQIKKFK